MAHLTADDGGVIVPCPQCGKANRVPYERLGGSTARCGHCKHALEPPSAPIDVDSAARFDVLVHAPVPLLVDFWAPWCGPCLAVAPEFDKVARSLRGQLLVAKVNTDQLSDLAARFQIRSIPTMAVFREGREAARTVGAMGADQIVRFVEPHLATVPPR